MTISMEDLFTPDGVQCSSCGGVLRFDFSYGRLVCRICGVHMPFSEAWLQYAKMQGWSPPEEARKKAELNFTDAFTTAAEALEILTPEERRRIIDALDKLYPESAKLYPTSTAVFYPGSDDAAIEAMVATACCNFCGVPNPEHRARGCDLGSSEEELIRRLNVLRGQNEELRGHVRDLSAKNHELCVRIGTLADELDVSP